MSAASTSSAIAAPTPDPAPISLERFRVGMWNQFHWTNRALRNRCRETFAGMSSFTSKPLADVLASWRGVKLTYARAKHQRARARSSRCEYDLAAAWADTSAARCVTSHEGGIASNTGNGYYGKWQADPSFAATYNPAASRRWGPYAYYHGGAWPEAEQDLMAWRGWKARGFYPWPLSARLCGLI